MLKGKTGAHRSSLNIELGFDIKVLMYFEFKCRIWEPELASVIGTRENSATERRTFLNWLDLHLTKNENKFTNQF